MCKQLDNSSHTAASADPTLSSSTNTSEPASPPPLTSATNSDESGSSSSTMKKTVSFQSVEIASYPMELGDNPSAEGLPITLGWECDFKLMFELEEYETSKPAPRRRDQFWMPARYREDLLSRQGVTASEMLRITKEVRRIQKSRHRSIKNQKWDKLHLFMEESGRKLKRITSVTTMPKTSSSDKLGSSLPTLNSSSKSRRPRSMSMSMLTSKWSSSSNGDSKYASRDPLDESTKSRISIHLLRHPEDLNAEESPTEELSDLNMEPSDHIRGVEDDHASSDGNLIYDPSIQF